MMNKIAMLWALGFGLLSVACDEEAPPVSETVEKSQVEAPPEKTAEEKAAEEKAAAEEAQKLLGISLEGSVG